MLCIMLVSILIFGGQTASSTAGNYIERGIGINVFLIANPKVAEKYVQHLSLYPPEGGQTDSADLWQCYEVNKAFIEWLEAQLFIEIVDKRIVRQDRALEIKLVKPVPGLAYVTIGDDRSADVLVVGVDPEKVVSNWVLNERFLTKEDKDSVVIGDSTLDIIYDFKQEKIKIIGKTFPITSVCVDPLNRGYTIYVPYETMSSILGVSNPNVVLIKVDQALKDEAINTVSQQASREGLVVLDLNHLLERDVNFINKLWDFIMILPTITLLSLVICLTTFIQFIVLDRIPDFRVMRAVGAKWSDVSKIVSAELLIIMLLSIPLGILIGLAIALNFLIPFSTFPPIGRLLFSLSVIGGLACILYAGSHYIIGKTQKKTFEDRFGVETNY